MSPPAPSEDIFIATAKRLPITRESGFTATDVVSRAGRGPSSDPMLGATSAGQVLGSELSGSQTFAALLVSSWGLISADKSPMFPNTNAPIIAATIAAMFNLFGPTTRFFDRTVSRNRKGCMRAPALYLPL